MNMLKKILFKLVKPLIKLLYPRDYWEENIFYCKRVIFGDAYVIADAGMNYIDKPEVDAKIAAQTDLRGISDIQGDPGLIVSLTTYPARMNDARYALFSLLQQTVKPDKVLLWLAEEEFPEGAPSLLSDFCNAGLTIEFCKNLRSYKKLVPTLQRYPDSVIVTADDDIFYDPAWLEKLTAAYRQAPQYIHCHRAHIVQLDENAQPRPYRKWRSGVSGETTAPSYMNFFIGCGGVLYPPHSLYQDVCDEKLFAELAPIGDDIWFWAMAVMQRTKINIVSNNISEMTYIDPAKELGIGGTPLWRLNVGRRINDKQLAAVFTHYGLSQRISQA